MVVFDDVSPASKLRIYDRGVERPVTDNYGEFELAYRHGEIVIPYIAWREPLRLECEHFIDCVRQRKRPLADGAAGLKVVRVVEAAQHVHERRLAGAVRADQADDLPAAKLERDLAQGLDTLERPRD